MAEYLQNTFSEPFPKRRSISAFLVAPAAGVGEGQASALDGAEGVHLHPAVARAHQDGLQAVGRLSRHRSDDAPATRKLAILVETGTNFVRDGIRVVTVHFQIRLSSQIRNFSTEKCIFMGKELCESPVAVR